LPPKLSILHGQRLALTSCGVPHGECQTHAYAKKRLV
jgi:hypothetical protein